MATKCNYDCNESGLSLNYFSFSLQPLPQDGVEINARPFPATVTLLVIRIKHHNSSVSYIPRRMAGGGSEQWPGLRAPVGSPVPGDHPGNGQAGAAPGTPPLSPAWAESQHPISLAVGRGRPGGPAKARLREALQTVRLSSMGKEGDRAPALGRPAFAAPGPSGCGAGSRGRPARGSATSRPSGRQRVSV